MIFKKKRKIRIAFGTIFYPLAMSRYMLEALQRRDDVELWTYGPFSGAWIPWGDGMSLPAKYVFTPDAPLPLGPSVQPIVRYGQMEMLKPWEPDLWLEVNAGLEANGRPVSGKYAVIGTDPHVLGQIYDRVRPRADYFFGMQSPYLGEGDIFLPYAYDPIWHSPSPIPMKDRLYDAALIGLQYASRTKLVNALRSRGLNVFYELGKVYDEARDIYHNTKVGFNWSSLQDTTARVYELMAMGTVPVLNRVPDLMRMFVDGTDFIGFDNTNEAVNAIEHYLENPEEAEKIATQAKEAVKEHTWDARMETVLRETGVLL